MEPNTTTSRAEAERLLGIAEKLLREKNLSGCKDFAVLAKETEPLLEGADQILAVADVLLAAEKGNNNRSDWYSILQVAPHSTIDVDSIKKQYRRLALLLHPDKNKLPFSDSAFRFVSDAWAVVSDPEKKALYDNEIRHFTKVELVARRKPDQAQPQKKSQPGIGILGQKLPVRRSTKGKGRGGGSVSRGAGDGVGKVDEKKTTGNTSLSPNFWTACPYCYNLYEYSRVYEECCLRCDSSSCKRTFTATEIPALPPTVPGKEAYYCCWSFFPLGFVAGNGEPQKCMPPVYEDGPSAAAEVEELCEVEPQPQPQPQPQPPPVPYNTAASTGASGSTGLKRKRGRPRKIQRG